MNEYDRHLTDVIEGRIQVVTVLPDGTVLDGVNTAMTVLPGAFNPLHAGHEGMLAAAAEITGQAVSFELSVVNVDKPELPESEVRSRLVQFSGRFTVLVSRAPTFLEKSRLMPDTSFVIGYDTAVRLFDDLYYPEYDINSDLERTGSAMLSAMSEIRRNGCDFVVAGRVTDEGFRTVDDLDIPHGYREMLQEIPRDVFRDDISSTQIRRSQSC
ncbi:MAG: hypothetical protein VB824_00980 [Dehalococcoidia bacterium]